jgi:putative ABC transport system permease protein
VTGASTRRPPRAFEGLLERALPEGEWRDAILGDLHQEYVEAARSEPRRAALRYAMVAVALAARGLVRRFEGPAGVAVGGRMRGWWMDDLKVALRSFRKRPAVTAVMVATLAVALGANGAVFGLLDALFLRPLEFDGVDRVAMLAEHATTDRLRRGEQSVAPATFVDWRREMTSFSGLAAADYWDANIQGPEQAERVQGFRVSPGFFGILGVTPSWGRAFQVGEDVPGRDRVAILGSALWARNYGSDPAVLGSAIVVDGEALTVVGIAPPGFDFPLGAELWAPLALTAEDASLRSPRYLTVLGRLAPGLSLADAEAELQLVDERLRSEHPELANRRAWVVTLNEGVRDVGVGPFLAVWQLSAFLVLAIACANVANLLLARGAERQRELALRQALGARRRRVLRQLLTESGALALTSALVALPIAHFAMLALRQRMPASIARFVAGWRQIDVDGRTIAFTTGIALLAVLAFGVLPALAATRPQLVAALRDGGRSATAGARRQRSRDLLVVAEIAVALSLLVGSALSVSSALRMLDGPQGYDPSGLLKAQTVLAEARYGDDVARARFIREALGELRRLAGVEAVAAANVLPATGENRGASLEIEGEVYETAADRPGVDWRSVTPGYFDVLRLPILEGRTFLESDAADALPVAIVSEALARRHWPGRSALGRRIRDSEDGPWATVVGVSGDVVHHWFAGRWSPTLYRPAAQSPTRGLALAVRVEGADPEALSAEMRRAVARVDPAQPLSLVQSQRRSIAENTIGLQYAAAIMGAFAAIALILAVSGVYGVMAYRVSQRTQEIGVRLALGGSRGQVAGLILGQTGRLAGAGVGVGLLLALALARGMEAAFVGVLSVEPLPFVAMASILAVAALAAGWVPTRRALAVDPSRALRAE